jgi:hypothetical protein
MKMQHTLSGGRIGRLVATAGVAVAVTAALAGCGTRNAPHGESAPGKPATSGKTTTRTVSTRTIDRPVPRGFAATSVTFVSATDTFVLGASRCASAVCTSIAHSINRGATWSSLPAPPARISQAGSGSGVWGIRFATPAQGFVFGAKLWQTTDGGLHWSQAAIPGGAVLSLAIVRGQVLAVTAHCSANNGCSFTGELRRRALSGGSWHPLASVRVASLIDPNDLIGTLAGNAALVNGSHVIVTSNGGLTHASHATPCRGIRSYVATSVAVTSATGSLALLCTGQGFTGHTLKRVYVSNDGGGHWTRKGTPPSAGDGGTLTAATPSDLVIATESAGSWLYQSTDGGQTWHTVKFYGDGGEGWADLGFTTSANAVVVHGPALSNRNSERRSGKLVLTANGGATWTAITF